MDLLSGILAGIGGVAGVWAIMRFIAPTIGDFVASSFKVSRDLDSDRERVITNLRAEVADFDRREDDLMQRIRECEAECKATRDELKAAELFISRHIRTPRPPRAASG